jgi:RNA polymerase sigma-70 factor (ECF subfamily)
MDDEPAESGIEAAAAGSIPASEPTIDPSQAPPPAAEPAVDKKARDLEFTLFYTEQMPRLVAFLIVHGARRGVAADVAQEAMTEAYRKWDSIDRPAAWIRTVASRTWWRRTRRDWTESPSEDLDEQATALSPNESEEIENRHAFLGILSSLPLGQRQVMAWTYDGYQPTEIAALLGKEPATARSLLRDARAALRKKYRSDEETP